MAQVSRILDTLGLPVALHEMSLLAAKYASPVTGHFNYHAFCADIDPSKPSPLIPFPLVPTCH